MKKDLGVKTYLFPMPTLMIGTYSEDDSVNVMMMAWGGICGRDTVALTVAPSHKTFANIEARKAFTLAVPGTDTIKESDFLGSVSGSKMPDKFARTGLHAVKSQHVDAPVIEEYPITLECELVEIARTSYGVHIIGKIVNVLADEKILDAEGNVDVAKANAFAFDSAQKGYYAIGEKIAQAWSVGAEYLDK